MNVKHCQRVWPAHKKHIFEYPDHFSASKVGQECVSWPAGFLHRAPVGVRGSDAVLTPQGIPMYVYVYVYMYI